MQDVVKGSELSTITEINELLEAPESRATILARRACRLSLTMAEFSASTAERAQGRCEPSETLSISEENFARLFDPASPTIVVDLTEGMRGGHFLARIAAAQRAEQKGTPNIVLTRMEANCAAFVSTDQDEHALQVTHGMLVDAEGVIYVGEFPKPIHPNLVESTNLDFVRQCAARNIATVNSPEAMVQSFNKNDIAEAARRAGIRSAERITPEELKHSWRSIAAEGFVIKPSNSASGKGVRFWGTNDLYNNAHYYYHFLQKHGYEPIIERKVPCYPLHDPETGQLVAWNARADIANGRGTSIYLRVGPLDKATNTTQGAKVVTLEDLPRYTDTETAQKLVAKLIEATHRLASTSDTLLMGDDLMIDPNFECYLIERNTGQHSGAVDLMEFYDDPKRKWRAVSNMVDAWREALQGQTTPQLEGAIVEKISPSKNVISFFKGLHDLGKVGLLSQISSSEFDQLAPGHFEHYLRAFSSYVEGRSKEGDLEETFIRQAPLELAHYLPLIAKRFPAFRLLEWIEILENIVGNDNPQFREAREILYARSPWRK